MERTKFKLMRARTFFYGFLMLFFAYACTESKQPEGIKGLLYLDGNPVSIEIVDGKIANIRQISSQQDMPKVYVAPGLIDIQINGYMGIDFSDQNLTVEDMRKVTKTLYKEGVTSYLPTVTTRDQERLLKSFSLLAKVLDDTEIGKSIPGFHLEGPYISPIKGFRGAHKSYIRNPNWNELQELQKTIVAGKVVYSKE